MTIKIGDWVQRKPRQKWHIVESAVSGDAVTRCGRRLADPFVKWGTSMPLTRAIGQPQLCKGCEL